MAKARLITAEERASATDPEQEFLEYQADLNYDNDTEVALEALKAQFAGSENKGTLWVYQLPLDERGEPIGNAKMVNLFNVPLDSYAMEGVIERIRSQFMKAGESAVFRVMASIRGQSGLKMNRLLYLRKPPEPEKPPVDSTKESVAALLKVMQDSQAQMFDRMDRMFSALAARQNQTPAMDPVQTAMGMVAAMSAMAGNLVRTTAAPATAPLDPMAMLTQTMSVMRSMRGFLTRDSEQAQDEQDPDSLVSVLRAGTPYLQTIGELLKRSAPPAVIRHRMKKLQRPLDPATAPVQPTVSPEVQNMFAQLRPQLEAITRSAAEGADAKDTALLVVQAIPEGTPVEEQFIEFLASEKWWASLKAIYPPVAPHEEWYKVLREAILAEYPTEEPG